MQNKPNLVRRRRIANELKLITNKELQKFYPAGGAKKQTQFKPNPRKAKNERKCLCHKGL